MDYGTGSLSCSGVVEAISLPSGSQLKDFPSAVRKEMQRIAVALLRRLLYPIMCRRMAQSYRNQTVKKLGDTGRFGSVLVKTLRQRSSLGSAMRRKKFLEDLDDRNPCVKALKESVTYRLYLKDEFIQYRGEPPNAVVFVVKGSIRRCATIEKVKKKRAALPKFSFSTEEMLASEYGSTQSCLCSVAADSGLNIQSEPTGAEKKTVLTAPVMVGEYCTVGNFPCPEYLVADSQFVIIGWIPKSAYCALLEALSQGIQRSILTRALKARERELPNYAPMTLSRMRMCPLLAQLGDDKVSTLMSQLVPQVCPAGVQIDGSSVQKHIYFIRRGVVYLQQDESTSQKNFCPSMPMSRSFYMEGHTFGERQCIFREALNSSFYTLSNVDLYLLPFSCVTQMMESNIDIRTQIYSSAKSYSVMLQKFYDGMRFVPPSLDAITGLILSSSILHKVSQRGSGGTAKRVTISGQQPPNRISRRSRSGLERSGMSPYFLEQVEKIPLVSLCNPESSFYVDCARCFRCITFRPGEHIVKRGTECNAVLFFCQGGAIVVDNESALRNSGGGGGVSTSGWLNLPRVPQGYIIGYTCVRRHLWERSIIAPDDGAEVWELSRWNFVEILRRYQIESQMHALVLQLMQPLCATAGRHAILDAQPLLTPSPASLWSEHKMPNFHPVSTSEVPRFPVWNESRLLCESSIQLR